MASNNYKDKGTIVKNGGGVLIVRQVSDVGAYTTGDDYNLGYLEQTSFVDEETSEDIRDETGQVVTSLYGDDTVKLSGTLLQSGVSLIDFFNTTIKDKFFQVYYKMTRTGEMDTKTQELFIGIAKIKKMINITSGNKRIPIEINILKNDAEISIATPQTVYGSVHASTVVIPIGKYYKVLET